MYTKSRMPSRLKEHSLVLSVYERIKREILSGDLMPGEPLLEEGLATRLGVSRTPVREALRKLVNDGLVRLVLNKGAFVRVLTPKDVTEIYELREALESYAAGRAALLLSKNEIQSFVALGKTLKRRGSRLRHKDLRDAWEFIRQSFLKALDNDRLKGVLTTMNEQIETARHYASAPPGRLEELLSDLIVVSNALKIRNSALASKLVQDHLCKSKEVLLDMFSPGRPGQRRKKCN